MKADGEKRPDYADLARRLTCSDCGHSASQHDEGGPYEDEAEACSEPGCECVEFHSLTLSKAPR